MTAMLLWTQRPRIKLFDELKALYAQQNMILEPIQQYSFKSAVELATKLIEREAASLDSKLRAESDLIKKCPEAALWVGIPTNLVPPEVLNSQSTPQPIPNPQRDSTFIPKPATFSDMLQIGQQRNMASLSHVSPLNAINPNSRSQIFTAAWGAPTTTGPGENTSQNKRRAPYQGRPNNRQNQNAGPSYNQGQKKGKRARSQSPKKTKRDSTPVKLSPKDLDVLRKVLNQLSQ